MQQAILPYASNSQHDYRLIVDTPLPVKKKIAAVKTAFDSMYKGAVISGGSPYIYLAAFSQYESGEQLMTEALEKVALALLPFKMHLRNFGSAGGNRIFIDVKEKTWLLHIVDKIKELSFYLPGAKFNEWPVITIGQRLQPWQFEKSWKIYEHQHFSATYLVDEMLLLKRMQGFKSWQVLERLKFQNMLVTG